MADVRHSCGSGYNGAWTNDVSAAETAVANLKVTLGNAGTGRLELIGPAGLAKGGLSRGVRLELARGLLAFACRGLTVGLWPALARGLLAFACRGLTVGLWPGLARACWPSREAG